MVKTTCWNWMHSPSLVIYTFALLIFDSCADLTNYGVGVHKLVGDITNS